VRRRPSIRPRHGTVVACLALFLALAGGALAAAGIGSGDIVNSSLKSVDLKNGKGVKGADVSQSSLRGSDVRAASLRGAQLADDSITGADVNEPSLVVSQLVARLGGALNLALPAPPATAIPNGAYTQAADETNSLIGGGQLTFSAACVQPRSAQVLLLIDSPVPSVASIIGTANLNDSNTGASTRSFTFGQLPPPQAGLTLFRGPAAAPHQFYVYGGASCNSGSGVTLDSAGVDVVAKR
jgi:uncharacterized protein YjbI with pentapeptide repeats